MFPIYTHTHTHTHTPTPRSYIGVYISVLKCSVFPVVSVFVLVRFSRENQKDIYRDSYMLGRHRYFRNWLARLTRPGQLPSARCRAGKLCVIRVQSGGLRSLRAGGVGPGLNQECWASEGRRRAPQLRQRAGLSLLCPLAGQCPPARGR